MIFLVIANSSTAIDSTVGDEGAMWIRSTGFDEAWEHVPGRARL